VRHRSGWREALAVTLAGVSLLSSLPALAEGDGDLKKQNQNIAVEGGLGAGSAIASFLWSPVKLVYAIGGLVIGGLGYAWAGADSEVSKRVLRTCLAGDYVITPKHLQGEKRFRFAGGGDL
jgi:hypothetical protein